MIERHDWSEAGDDWPIVLYPDFLPVHRVLQQQSGRSREYVPEVQLRRLLYYTIPGFKQRQAPRHS